MNIIAIINQKGGTGKTTTAVNLAAGLAACGRSTLLVDLDPQAHATYGLGVDLEGDKQIPTLADVLSEEHGNIAEIIVSTPQENLKLAPSDIRLAKAAALMHTRNFREQVLARTLEPVKARFQYILIDCQPTLDVLSVNAIVAADKILIPTELSGYALRGFTDLLETILALKNNTPGFDYRILLTKVTGLAADRQEHAWSLLKPVADRILTTRIRRTEAIERSQMETDDAEGLIPVILQEKWNKGARDYRAAVKEILELWPN